MTVVALPFPSSSDKPLRVLTPDLSARITKINLVRRLLNECGIQIQTQDLVRNGNRPLLRLAKGDPRLRRIATSVRQYGDQVTAVIHGVDVQWPVEMDRALGC